MTDVREYEVTTDYGVMKFSSDDVVGYWWEQIAEEMNSEPCSNFRPNSIYGVISLVIQVPPSERSNPANDIAEAYAVETGDDIPGGCIIWGKYRGEWVANVSGRWLISRFLKSK
jgi:hypothetical protein